MKDIIQVLYLKVIYWRLSMSPWCLAEGQGGGLFACLFWPDWTGWWSSECWSGDNISRSEDSGHLTRQSLPL